MARAFFVVYFIMVKIVFVVGVVNVLIRLCKDNANRMQSPSSSLETAMLRCRLSYAKLIKKIEIYK